MPKTPAERHADLVDHLREIVTEAPFSPTVIEMGENEPPVYVMSEKLFRHLYERSEAYGELVDPKPSEEELLAMLDAADDGLEKPDHS